MVVKQTIVYKSDWQLSLGDELKLCFFPSSCKLHQELIRLIMNLYAWMKTVAIRGDLKTSADKVTRNSR